MNTDKEVHIQQCQVCGSDQLRNILLRETGERDRVMVQCQNCQSFVASYCLAPMGYYHHNKDYDSFLRSLMRSGEVMSGRRMQDLYEHRVKTEKERFERAQKLLHHRDEKPGDQEDS